MHSTELVLPTFEELSRGMDLAMQRGMIAAMTGNQELKEKARAGVRHYADKIKAGEYRA